MIEESSVEMPRERFHKKEPQNFYEFAQAFSQYGGMPVGYYLTNTKHWPKDMRWHMELVSLLKEKNLNEKAKIINWYIREAKTKEI
jgi:hypothetical protein